MRQISESDGIVADELHLCPVCFLTWHGLKGDCRVIPPAVRRARRALHARLTRMCDEFLEDEPTWRGNGIFRTPPHAYVLWERHKRRVNEAMDAALLRWSLQREHLDPIEITELELDPTVANMAMIALGPGEPPPQVEPFGLLNIGIVISAPRPGPHPGVALAVG